AGLEVPDFHKRQPRIWIVQGPQKTKTLIEDIDMKQSKLPGTWLILAMALVSLGLSGCASTKEHKTEPLLSAAGFQSVTPSTPQQQAAYAALPAHKMQRTDWNGKTVYAYADKKAG